MSALRPVNLPLQETTQALQLPGQIRPEMVLKNQFLRHFGALVITISFHLPQPITAAYLLLGARWAATQVQEISKCSLVLTAHCLPMLREQTAPTWSRMTRGSQQVSGPLP